MLYAFLTILYLLCLGAMTSALIAEGLPPTDTPPIYYAKGFLVLIKLFMIPTAALLVTMFIMNWKITLVVLFVSWLLARIALKPISERLIVLPLHLLLSKRASHPSREE